jgi:hypothetical protein
VLCFVELPAQHRRRPPVIGDVASRGQNLGGLEIGKVVDYSNFHAWMNSNNAEKQELEHKKASMRNFVIRDELDPFIFSEEGRIIWIIVSFAASPHTHDGGDQEEVDMGATLI